MMLVMPSSVLEASTSECPWMSMCPFLGTRAEAVRISIYCVARHDVEVLLDTCKLLPFPALMQPIGGDSTFQTKETKTFHAVCAPNRQLWAAVGRVSIFRQDIGVHEVVAAEAMPHL